MDRFRLELQRAFRSLLKAPVFALMALLTVALGCTANTAIFSVLYSTLMKPLPYTEAERLVSITATNPSRNISHVGISPSDFVSVKESASAFSELGFYTDQAYTLTGLGDPETLIGFQVSSNLFPLLGTKPMLGRLFAPGEGAAGDSQLVLLSHHFWQRHYGSERNVVGRTVTLEGKSHTIVGVMPPDFMYPSRTADIWTPLELAANAREVRNVRYLRVVARLKPGVPIEQARSQIQTLAANLSARYPDTNAPWRMDVRSIRDAQVGDLKLPLMVMQGGAFLLFLVGSLNFGNLLLARALDRQRQVAIQIALGAENWNLFSRPVAEGFILCLLGSIVAMFLSALILGVLPSIVPAVETGQAILPAQGFAVEGWILALSAVLCFAVGLVAGCLPVLRAMRSDSEAEMLGETGRANSRVIARSPLRTALIVTEVAVSLILLIGSGLMIRSQMLLSDQPLGFEPERVLTMRIVVPMNRYAPPAIAPFVERVEAGMRAIPGVESVGSTSVLPMSGMGARRPFRREQEGQAAIDQQQANFRLVTPGYFKSMRVRLLYGRDFDARDRAGSVPVIVVNESLARLFGDPRKAVGSRLLVSDFGNVQPRDIIGVVGDVRDEGPASQPQPTVYRPFAQLFWPVITFTLKTSVNPMTVVSAATAAIWSADRGLPVNNISSMNDVVAESLSIRRNVMLVLTLFAMLGLFSAVLGLYGLISYDVSQRSYEIGIRLALGADRSKILWLILSYGMRLVSIGFVGGLVVSLALTRMLSSLLFGVRPNDPATFIVVALMIAAVSAAACLVPSLRAMRLDPALVLRAE